MTFIVTSPGQVIRRGIVAGVVSGLVFTIFQLAMTQVLVGDALGYLRIVSSIVLGPESLAPAYPLNVAIVVGILIRLSLATGFGVIFSVILTLSGQTQTSQLLIVLYGTAYGFALWIINFLTIAPLFFPQFTTVDQFWLGFVAHTFLYGTVLGVTYGWSQTVHRQRPIGQ